MKLKYIFIPAILLTILVVGICKHYYNLDLLSMDHVCMISIASFIAFFTVFFGISVCAYEASKAVAERQTEHIDQLSRFIAQHVNECFKAHDGVTKDVLKQELKEVTNLLIDVKSLSLWARNNSLAAKDASANCERLSNEAIERLDNILKCLTGDEVIQFYNVLNILRKEKALIYTDSVREDVVGEDEIKVIGE